MNEDAVLFDISDQGLKAAIPIENGGELSVPVNHYRAIVADYRAVKADESETVLGVRKCYPKFGKNPTGVITNKEALQTMKDLFFDLFHEKGEIIYSYPDKEPDNWSVILMGNTEVDMNSWLYRYLNLNPYNEKVNPDSQQYISREFLDLFHEYSDNHQKMKDMVYEGKNDLRTLLSNYSIVLAMKNGYDFGDELHFYVLIKVKDSALDIKLNNSNLLQSEFLTLSSFSFHMSDFGEIIREQVGGNAQILSEIVKSKEVAYAFEKSLVEFARVYERLHSIYVDLEDLIAITLDILNLNRNERRLKYDKKQRSIIGERLRSLSMFYDHSQRHTLASILGYIFKSVTIDISNKRSLHDNIQSILTKKDSYKSVKDFLYDLTLKPKEYDDYLDAQLKSLKNIRQILSEI